ncbi:hypothetical protein J1N35_001374 [Gossypium stocksii]|uniref:RNase H type-1 domain-containing protein n=1 Tax=Gossypium stocksii TaxID=47602 RepID=A0A9D3WK97_9ROSI|nr:hypothetical protein J1N35_001374 [Gossypium stocksii]
MREEKRNRWRKRRSAVIRGGGHGGAQLWKGKRVRGWHLKWLGGHLIVVEGIRVFLGWSMGISMKSFILMRREAGWSERNNGLKGWAARLQGGQGGKTRHLHDKLQALDMVDQTDDNLMDLLNAHLEMNLEIDKIELFWEQQAREATKGGALVLKQILKEYEHFFGQCVNFNKSVIYFSSKVVESLEVQIATSLGGGKEALLRVSCKLFPLFICRVNDFLVWRGESMGEFTVHNSYELLLQELDRKSFTLSLDSDRWRPPQQGFFKINFDVTFDIKENRLCLGIIVRNFKGDTLASDTMVHENIPSVFVAEAIACLQAVTVNRDLGITHVVIEGDSLMVIKKVQNTERDKLAIGPYIHEVEYLSEVFHGCLKMRRNAYLVNGDVGQEITELEIDCG